MSEAVVPDYEEYTDGDSRGGYPPLRLVEASADDELAIAVDSSTNLAQIDVLDAYIAKYCDHEVLTAAQELDLAKLIDEGRSAQQRLDAGRKPSEKYKAKLEAKADAGREAREALINSNLRLVIGIAKRYNGPNTPLIDSIMDGNAGLIEGIDRFDYRKGFKLSTYATWWIKQSVQRSAADTDRTIRWPMHIRDRIRWMRAAEDHIWELEGRQPTDEEYCYYAGITQEELAEVREARQQRVVSANLPMGDFEEDAELQDLFEDDTPEMTDVSEAAELKRKVGKALGGLSAQEAEVISLFFGLKDDAPLEMPQIGKKLKINPKKVQSIKDEALKKLAQEEELKHLSSGEGGRPRDYLVTQTIARSPYRGKLEELQSDTDRAVAHECVNGVRNAINMSNRLGVPKNSIDDSLTRVRKLLELPGATTQEMGQALLERKFLKPKPKKRTKV